MSKLILEVLQSIIHNYNNLEIIENILDQQFAVIKNQPITKDKLVQFSEIYRSPIVYVNIGIDITKYDNFLEMISINNSAEKRLIGEILLEYSYRYKMIQEFKIELIERCKILCLKYNMVPIYERIYEIFKKYKEYFDKNIFETYYQYYNASFV